MNVGYALLCGLLVELADLGFAVAGYFEETLGEFDGVSFGLGLDEGEASDNLFANARAEGGEEAPFGGEQAALFKCLLDEFAHCFHHLWGWRGALLLRRAYRCIGIAWVLLWVRSRAYWLLYWYVEGGSAEST
jgi:hypothetical protein